MPESLLCVINFPASVGYAWDFIEDTYVDLADRLGSDGVATWVAYPEMTVYPERLRGSRARPVRLEVRPRKIGSVLATLRFIREQNVKVVYLPDGSVWEPAFLAFRLAGVRRIIVHDHTSGDRVVPRGPKRLLKWLSRRLPFLLADEVITVSDYVANRTREVDLLPASRVRRIWNSVALPDPDAGAASRLRRTFGIAESSPVVLCACRAAPEKGVEHLFRAFDRMLQRWEPGRERPVLVYVGDGPHMAAIRECRSGLDSRDSILLAGYRADAAELAGGADICVLASVWQEAFGLAVLEAMSRGRPIVASAVGGIPEIVVHGETGLLVPPGDESELERAIHRLLMDRAERQWMGDAGRRRAAALFSRATQMRELHAVLGRGFRNHGRGSHSCGGGARGPDESAGAGVASVAVHGTAG